MKNNYLLKDHYIIQLENDTLREQLKELKAENAKLKMIINEKEMCKVPISKGTGRILRKQDSL
jgi:regulator of replication initiation timing